MKKILLLSAVFLIGSITGWSSPLFAATLTRTPVSLTFGPTNIGATSAVQTVTISNTSAGNLNNISFSLSGADSSRFTVTTTGVATPCLLDGTHDLANGGSCNVGVTFSPNTGVDNVFSATLNINSQNAGSATTSLSGTSVGCFNGAVDAGEDCDDGNGVAGDCCDDTCHFTTNACSDGNNCTTGDSCSNGSCAGTAVVCSDDGNVCTDDVCNPSDGSCGVNNTVACEDGSFCNGTDTCGAGTCSQHTGNPCSGGAECNNICDEANDNCAVAAGITCSDDGNVCTDNQCNGSGSCVHPNNASPCSDGLFCNGGDTCNGGTCSLHAGDPCSGGSECNDVCNEGADNCFVAGGTACTTDGNTCTNDACNGSGTCGHANNTNPCDDGLFCNGTDTCNGGGCNDHTGDPCSGGGDCNDTCQETADNCLSDSGTACTDDGNVCTDDQCDGTGACDHPNNTVSCDDGDACSDSDVCSEGVCVGASLCGNGTVDGGCGEECDDGNAENGDCCSDACLAINESVVCEANGGCLVDGICTSGSCVGGSPEPDGTVCDDSDACTQTDTCQSSTCVGTDPVVCIALDDCHEAGVCDPATGECSDPNMADGTPCDDGEDCSLDDQCVSGECQAGGSTNCGDGTLDESCGEQCDDGNLTDDDGCSATCVTESQQGSSPSPSGGCSLIR